MKKNCLMSYFNAPISKYVDKQGRTFPASVRPLVAITLEQLVNLITENPWLKELTEQVRKAPNLKEAKKELLPFITPMGTFSYRKSEHLIQSSGLVVVDVDGNLSFAEAEQLRDKLFNDPYLQPVLCFISPSGKGVKALIPYQPNPEVPVKDDIAQNLFEAMLYVGLKYNNSMTAEVDVSGKDIVRSCFLCHDAQAKYRLEF